MKPKLKVKLIYPEFFTKGERSTFMSYIENTGGDATLKVEGTFGNRNMGNAQYLLNQNTVAPLGYYNDNDDMTIEKAGPEISEDMIIDNHVPIWIKFELTNDFGKDTFVKELFIPVKN